MSDRAADLVGRMTLGEKVSLLAGATMWETVPIERLGIPSIKMTDGPNGARGGDFSGGVTAAAFPVGIALAATWDPELVYEVGQALAEEAQSKGAGVLLAPTVNMHRSPLNGRNFECYSEDPYLAARLAVAYITGVQSRGVAATVKHFIANDSEYQRNSISSDLDERTMREIYLPPFEAAVREAGSWAVMASYNKVNGTHAGENADTLCRILKEEWGFDGIVMSDWFGTKSTEDAARNGLDLEMPGPAVWRGKKLLAAVEDGRVAAEAIDDAATRLLRLVERVGGFESPRPPKERAIDRPEHRALIRRAGAEGAVLLKNDGVLPLRPDELRSVAVVGPNAKTAQIMGGGSAQVNAHYAVAPFDALVSALGDKVGYALGCSNHRYLPKVEGLFQVRHAGAGGEPVAEEIRGSEKMWIGTPEGLPGAEFTSTISGRFTPEEPGVYTFGLTSGGPSRLAVDGREVVDNWTRQTPGDYLFGMGSAEATGQMELEAGQSYDLEVSLGPGTAGGPRAFRLGVLPPAAGDALEEAVQLAARSDVALVFVGLNGEWESEGFDRPDMDLVGRQNELVSRVAAVNPRTVVVLQTGSPVTMPWLGDVAAVLQAWYPGQECGNGVADILLGRTSPSGKLPQTFPRRLEDNPAYINYPGEHGHVRYGEGIYIGYRYYDKKDVEPLFPFGFGLSYTKFAYDDLHLSSAELGPGERLTVAVTVTNTGDVTGRDIVQVYVRDREASVSRPEKELKGFASVTLEPGERREVRVELDPGAFAFWDDARHTWMAEEGEFEILVGASSRDIRARTTVRLTETSTSDGPGSPGSALTMGSPIRELLANERARAVVERHLPGFSQHPMLRMALDMTLPQVAAFAPEVMTDDTLDAIAGDLDILQEEARSPGAVPR